MFLSINGNLLKAENCILQNAGITEWEKFYIDSLEYYQTAHVSESFWLPLQKLNLQNPKEIQMESESAV